MNCTPENRKNLTAPAVIVFGLLRGCPETKRQRALAACPRKLRRAETQCFGFDHLAPRDPTIYPTSRPLL